MAKLPPSRKKAPKSPVEDRRAPESAKGLDVSLRKLKGALGRPMALQRRDGALHVVLVDRRRAARSDRPPPLEQVREELRTRLFVQQHEGVAQVMRHLVAVHDALGRKGWPSVAELSLPVLAKALLQAQMLASDDPSPALGLVIEQLRMFKVAAELRAERAPAPQQTAAASQLEVSEVTQQEFEDMERSWQSTMAAVLVPSDPGR